MVSEERVPILGARAAKASDDLNGSPWCPVTTVTSSNSAVPEPPPRDEEKAQDLTESGKDSRMFWFRLSSAKKATLVLMCLANVSACACFSLLAPFFPAEAALKGMSEGTIGMVFSCYELWVFLTSPLFGNYMVHIGHRFAFLAGQFLAGGCSILFGTLYMCPPGVPFTVLTFLLRSTMALGASAFSTASFTLVANEFPDNISIVFAALEVFTGIGYMVGPLLGGVLYELGGFGTPFFLSGSFLLVLTLITHLLLPVPSGTVQQQSRQGSVVHLLASPLIVVCCITLVSGCYTFGFMDASLALHLELFHVSAAVTGLCFMSMAAVYAIISPFFGWLSDRKNISYSLLIFGSAIDGVALLLLGPSPLLPFLTANLGLLVFALVLTGVGTGAIIIPVIKCFYIGARRLGFQDGMELDGLLSGLLNSSLHFGTFLGPTIGSSVMQATSYEWSITLNAGFLFLALIFLILYKVVERTCLKYDDTDKLACRPSQNSSSIILAPEYTSLPEDQSHTTSSSSCSSSSSSSFTVTPNNNSSLLLPEHEEHQF